MSRLLAILLFAASAHATSYYISTSGSDTNNGTSTDTPWQNLVKITAGSFNPTDSIFLKAGDVFDGPIVLGEGGTNTGPITIGRYGTGDDPIVYGDHPSAVWAPVGGHANVYSYTLWSGCNIDEVYNAAGTILVVTNKGAETLDEWLDKFQTNNWGVNASIIYVKTAEAPTNLHLFEWAIVSTAEDYVEMQDLDVRNGNIGIAINSGRAVKVQNCSVSDTMNIAIFYGSHSSYGTIATNTCTRNGETTIYLQTGGYHYVAYNDCSWTGKSVSGNTILGITIPPGEQCAVGLERGTNNIVEFNTFSNQRGAFIDYYYEIESVVRYNYGLSANGAAYPHGSGLLVHHNIWNQGGAGPGFGGGHYHDVGLSPGPDAGTNIIFNNIVYNFTQYGIYSATNTSDQIVYANNIFVTTSSVPSMVECHTGIELNYNTYYSTATAKWNWNQANYATLALFRTASGQEANGIHDNPDFVTASPVTAADFKVLLASPCVDAGRNLIQAGLLDSAPLDYAGRTIPKRAGWDIGAYEYGNTLTVTGNLFIGP